MIRDRLPDLVNLAQSDPSTYFEPEIQEEIPMPNDLEQLLHRTEKLLKFLNEMKIILNDLKSQHQGVLTSSSVFNTNQLREKITRQSNRFSALARKTETILRRIELSDQEKLRYGSQVQSLSSRKNRKRDISVKWNQTTSSVKVSWPSVHTTTPVYIPAEVRMQMTIHDVLSGSLTSLVHQFYTEQKNYNEASQKKIERQLSILGKTVSQEDINRIMDENLPLLHPEIHDDKQVSKEMRAKLKEVAHFEKEILLLEKNITQLHNAFLMISKFVYEQGAMVDSIANNVLMASDFVETSNQHLKKAGKLQNKYRKKKFIIVIVVIVLLAIVATIIAVTVIKRRNKVTVQTSQHPK